MSDADATIDRAFRRLRLLPGRCHLERSPLAGSTSLGDLLASPDRVRAVAADYARMRSLDDPLTAASLLQQSLLLGVLQPLLGMALADRVLAHVTPDDIDVVIGHPHCRVALRSSARLDVTPDADDTAAIGHWYEVCVAGIGRTITDALARDTKLTRRLAEGNLAGAVGLAQLFYGILDPARPIDATVEPLLRRDGLLTQGSFEPVLSEDGPTRVWRRSSCCLANKTGSGHVCVTCNQIDADECAVRLGRSLQHLRATRPALHGDVPV